MLQRKIHGVRIECTRGDIAAQDDMDAVVNAANAQLRSGGGVAGALHAAAGPGLAEECAPHAPIEPGEAVITGAHDLPNRYVIHCLGPVHGRDAPADELLAACYRRALALAEDKEVASIAFPALSTGAFGYPAEPAARVALGTVLDELEGLTSIRHIRFVLYDDADRTLYLAVLDKLAG